MLVEVDPSFYTIHPAHMEAAIGPRTKAVIAVHLYGQPADMEAITAIANRFGIAVIEDCAQAAGGRIAGRRVGSIGNIGCFSFYPTKNLGAIGDGGMVITDNPRLAERARQLRQYGWDDARQTHEAGLNSRLDPLQAAILGAKLPHLDADNLRRAAIAERYRRAFDRSPVTAPLPRREGDHVYHLYVIACDRRDALAKHLANAQIGCAVHYPIPVHRQKGYGERVIVPADGLPITERLADRILSLPIYPELSDGDVERVIAAVRGYCQAANEPGMPGLSPR